MAKYRVKQQEVEAVQFVNDTTFADKGDWLVVQSDTQCIMKDQEFQIKYELIPTEVAPILSAPRAYRLPPNGNPIPTNEMQGLPMDYNPREGLMSGPL
jgi:hypothetical protein